MIISDNRPAIEATGLQKETFFNVKQENLAHVFSILRNQLYSNKEEAIIREYCTNAFDAHVEAGIPEVPIEVTVPTSFNSDLIIRDHGYGLSEDDVHNIFASYGESTKRNTNNQVGMMGLGSKSAFCYSDSFTIVSHHNGTKTTYSAFIDDTGIGKISQVFSEPTEETGLSIQVPVKRYDAFKFEKIIFEFIKEFSPKPIIHNSPDLSKRVDEYKPKVVISGLNWEMRENQSSNQYHYVKMGNVFYPFNFDNIDLDYDLRNRYRSFYRQIIIFANIGDVKPAASRELLDFTASTKNYLAAKLNDILNECQEKAEEKILNAPNFWNAMITFREVGKFLKNGIDFDIFNKKISSSILPLPKTCTYHRNFNENKWKATNLIPETGQTIFLFKGNVPRKTIFVRANTYAIQNNLNTDKIFLIGFDNEVDANDWLNEGWLDGAKVVDVASIPYIQKKKERIKQGFEKADVYEFTATYLAPRNRDFWVARDISVLEEEGNVYIPIKYFQPDDCLMVKGGDNPNHNLVSTIKLLKDLGIQAPKVYGIQPKDIKNLPDDWCDFDTYVQNALNDLSDSEVKQILYTTLRNEYDYQDFWLKFGNELGEDDTTGLYALVQEWNDIALCKSSIRSLIKYGYQFDLTPIQPLIGKIKQMAQDFPLLDCYNGRFSLLAELARYVKALS